MGKVFVWLFGIGTAGSLGFLALFRRAIGIVLIMMMGVYAIGQLKGDVIGLVKMSMMNSQETIDKNREFELKKLQMEAEARREELKIETDRERQRLAAEAAQRREEQAAVRAKAQADAQAAKAAAQEAERLAAEGRRAEAERQIQVARIQAESRAQAERDRQREVQIQNSIDQRLANFQYDPVNNQVTWTYAGTFYMPNSKTRFISDSYKYTLFSDTSYTQTKNGITSEVFRQQLEDLSMVPNHSFTTTFLGLVYTLESDCATQRWRMINARYYHSYLPTASGLSATITSTEWRSFNDNRPPSRACR